MKVNLGSLHLTSPSFADGDRLPVQHSSDGSGVSPELAWSTAPEATQSFALVCHDPDAPLIRGFVHWVAWNIPPDWRGIPEGGGDGFLEGINGYGSKGWAPAAPPAGHGIHRYYFHLYAVDRTMPDADWTAEELLAQIDAHVLEQARLVGTYDNA
jgi:Raf kinase inhibitor-like YbhB/YbcL family protein